MDGLSTRRMVLLNTPHLESGSGELLTFNTDMKSPLKQCKVEFPPTQEGSGEPSYDNVRPIKGWTGLEAYLSGENLICKSLPEDAFYGNWSTNSTSIGSAANSMVYCVYVGKNRDLRYTRNGTSIGCLLAFTDEYVTNRSGVVLYGALNMLNRPNTHVNSGEHPYLLIALIKNSLDDGGDYDTSEVRLCFGSDVKPFTPRRNINKYICDWSEIAGTRYGGYIDLATGEMVVDWVYFLFDRNSRVNNSGTTETATWMTLRITHRTPPFQNTPNNGDDYGVFSLGNWRYSAQVGKNRAYVNSSYINVVLLSDTEDLTTAEGRTAYFDRLETNDIPIEVAYKRATPLRFQLTPQQIDTLKGINTIWSDANGDIDVKYWTH